MKTLAVIAFLLAALPALLFLVNLAIYRRLAPPRPQKSADRRRVSVLIPARNEASVIRAAIESVLANRGVQFEVVVMDDGSTDGTRAIVAEIAARDSRVRVAEAPLLPAGWCGKQHACHMLAGVARHPWLVFLDADVRLAADGLARMIDFVETRGIQLASGVPRQVTGTCSERLLIPLIHFVLLGYLPMLGMRWSRSPAFSAGCGQLFIAEADSYRQAGGHAQISASLHDGVQLPRAFRRAGFRTDLFDATDIAECRMYRSNAEVWRGLAKNATEGLGAPGRIVPMTLLLAGGAVLPVLLLALWPWLGVEARGWTLGSAFLCWLPRMIAAARFRQSPGSALLHPAGVLALLGVQWYALGRSWSGEPSVWKGRAYPGLRRASESETSAGIAPELP